ALARSTASSCRSCSFNLALRSLASTCARRSLALSPDSLAACLSSVSASVRTSAKSLTSASRLRSNLAAVICISSGKAKARPVRPRVVWVLRGPGLPHGVLYRRQRTPKTGRSAMSDTQAPLPVPPPSLITATLVVYALFGAAAVVAIVSHGFPPIAPLGG